MKVMRRALNRFHRARVKRNKAKAEPYAHTYGKDLWSRRPNSGATCNKDERQRTIKIERAQERELLHKTMRGFEDA